MPRFEMGTLLPGSWSCLPIWAGSVSGLWRLAGGQWVNITRDLHHIIEKKPHLTPLRFVE